MLHLSNRALVENALKAARAGSLAAEAGMMADGGLYYDVLTGCHCAIGASLPQSVIDDLIRIGFNGIELRQMDWLVHDIDFEDVNFAADLQNAHDYSGDDLGPPDCIRRQAIPHDLMVWNNFSSPIEALEAILKSLPETA